MTDTTTKPVTERTVPHTIPMTCIVCPLGCQMKVTRTETAGENGIEVTGNTCPRGEAYAKKELTNPTRTFTCAVLVTGGIMRLVPAKSVPEIPRDKQLACMEVIKRLAIPAPVRSGDVLCADILNTGANIVACSSVAAQ